MSETDGMRPLLLTLDQVSELIPLSSKCILIMEKEGTFPSSIYVTPRIRRWRYFDVMDWANSRNSPTVKNIQDSKGQLYRHFNKEGALLYVGISLSHLSRLSQHKSLSEWFDDISLVTIEHYPTRFLAGEAEKNAINTENPVYNKIRYKDFECAP